jgi:hypothetical protein
VRPAASSRIVITAAGFAVALAGVSVAVGVGAVPMPLAARTAKATEASPATQSQLSLSSAVMATFAPHIAKVSAVPKSVTAKPSRSAKAPATPTATPSTASASASPSPSTSSPAAPSPTTSAGSGLVPTALPGNVTPTGTNQLAWSEAILTALGAPRTDANIISMGYWMQNETGSPPSGMVGENNPINVSEPGYDGWNIKSEGNGWYLRSYPTVADGVAAIAAYLSTPSYTDIKAALQAGAGLSSSSLASELSIYSGGGYTTIPDAWGSSQGQPET